MYAYPAEGSTGDDDAFTAMCERYRSRLVAFCGRRLRTSHDAEDVAHEALLRAYRALPAFDDSSDAWPWLRTIAARVCTDLQRRAARAPTPASVEMHTADDVHEQVVGRLRAEILDDALGQLPTRYRTPLLLKEYGGWSYDDIARTQGKSLSSVRSLLTRSRRRLGTHVESVARERGQWPLPGVVPPMQRLRTHLRSWRDALDRSSQAVVAAFELSSVTTRWLVGANATLASMLGVSTAATAAVLPSAAPAVASNVGRPAVAVGFERSTRLTPDTQSTLSADVAVNVAPPPPETFARIDPTTMQPDFGPGLSGHGHAELTGNDQHLWVTYTSEGDERPTASVNVPCQFHETFTVGCSIARPLLGELQGH